MRNDISGRVSGHNDVSVKRGQTHPFDEQIRFVVNVGYQLGQKSSSGRGDVVSSDGVCKIDTKSGSKKCVIFERGC